MKSNNYYENSLNAQKLFQVYQTDLARVKQYLAAEIDFVCSRLSGHESILELGAGYGRIVRALADSCHSITGIDISVENVALGHDYLKEVKNAHLMVMDVDKLSLEKEVDIILCLQNGLSAMKIDRVDKIKNLLDHVKPGGHLYISTYSEKFWAHRLAWFIEQADKGLLGEIDLRASRDGVIKCKDGFTAITHSPEDLERIGQQTGYPYEIIEVDESSLFLVIHRQ